MLLKSGKVKLLCGNEIEGEKDGQKYKYYDLALMEEGKAYNMSCSKLAYEDSVKIGSFKDVYIVCEYNPNYKSCRAVQVVQ